MWRMVRAIVSVVALAGSLHVLNTVDSYADSRQGNANVAHLKQVLPPNGPARVKLGW